MPAKKELKNKNKRNDVARVLGFLALFFVSALVGVAIGIVVTQAIKRFALVAPQNAETIAQASAGKVLGEKEFQIAQTPPLSLTAPKPHTQRAPPARASIRVFTSRKTHCHTSKTKSRLILKWNIKNL
ncbi:MAG: hypothetical protein UW39_C0037G0003 [Parcubacteria group bacterium GW2011_GWC2_44_17]|uniref:Uncharacterized protein n=1 Tax=Candidatus Jacksonbacteria bacterium RIFCSPLOWO2_02_FULL_44_20 TaxID=1798460 RepID=A0A1G2A8W1_9BACT|nr:MAG: hypothetical protein UW39_C0037G0003 [Parcubacteria group bacterium GW2011_GWC2_44_17]OGY71282.1 MAG: hypothetical protein A3E05_01925 [Candidatus Jacksonbacteria bacterium RIFCSPHIGHO2_12_FULL_44_12]OGY72507.1 MAG: hypothetical protein A3H61_01545 [Candidatus Jacksonbacteria bacterium RIFCSPLOWO2_02_FULL_44_20]